MAETNSGTLVNTPRRSLSVVMSRKKRSIMFSHDAEVGMKCMYATPLPALRFDRPVLPIQDGVPKQSALKPPPMKDW